MIPRKLYALFSKQYKVTNINYVPLRNVQVSIIGAASEIGSSLALLVKQNCKVTKLHLYDDDERVKGIGLEIGLLPGGPIISTFACDSNLGNAIRSSDLVVMVSRIPRKPGSTREDMIGANAPAVQKLCKAIAEQNPETFFAISTNPLNSIIPLVSALMYKYSSYNPFKIFGITHIDTARSRAFAANALKVNARHLQVPVIGGHSDETIIPLFSNLLPNFYTVDPCQADMLTRLVRKAGTEVIMQKQGVDAATVAMAWSINEFVQSIVDALHGREVVVNCYTANPHFGTRFFAGPTCVNTNGISQTCCNLPMSDYECYLLNCCVTVINREVAQGEDYVDFMDNAGGK